MATLTENINYLQPTGFKLIMDRKHFPNLTFFATSVSHPSISLSATNVSFRRADIKIAGDKLTFGELQCNIIMDEDMTAYQEMYDWMKALVETGETSPRERSDTIRPSSADISLIALTSNNNQVKTSDTSTLFLQLLAMYHLKLLGRQLHHIPRNICFLIL